MSDTDNKLTSVASQIDTILVPRGVEHRAVLRGLRDRGWEIPLVLPIPMGINAVTTYLKTLLQTKNFLNKPPTRVLLIGLCGSLSPEYQIGDVAIYRGCSYGEDNSWRECDGDLSRLFCDRLLKSSTLVNGLSCDRVIWSAQEKVYLGRTYRSDVVDMEGYAVLDILTQWGISVVIVRVVSDDCQQDIPNLTPAISSQGTLKPLSLAKEMLRNPFATLHLIRGSLRGLKKLQQVTHNLF